MPKQPAMRGAHLDWGRELCKKGCPIWVPWYKTKQGETVRGCLIGLIPERRDGRWYCRQRKEKHAD